MEKFWVFKTYRSMLEDFLPNKSIGIDRDGIDVEYTIYEEKPSDDPNLLRSFDRFCKYMSKGDYIFLGVGDREAYSLKAICKVDGDYRFNMVDDVARHRRDIEVLKIFDEELPMDAWNDLKDIDLVDSREAMDYIIKYCL